MLTMYFDSNRNVMGDLYKNVINSFEDKKKIVVIVPHGYSSDEFSDEFLLKIVENISCQENKIMRIYKLVIFAFEIKSVIMRYKINSIYAQTDQCIYNLILYLVCGNLNYNIWMHDVTAHEGESFFCRLKNYFTKKILLPRYNNIVVSYSKARDELASTYSALKGKIHVIYLPRLKELEFEDIKKSTRQIKYDFIFYGRIEKYKGLDLLLDAMGNESMRKIRLLIVGKGREDNNIKKRIKKMKNIEFVNKYVSNRQLAEYIMTSRYVILPYRNATGTQTIQLANYYGKMVLATKVGCFTEYIKEGINGYFIDDKTKESLIVAMRKRLEYNAIDKDKMNENLCVFDLQSVAKKLQGIINSNM